MTVTKTTESRRRCLYCDKLLRGTPETKTVMKIDPKRREKDKANADWSRKHTLESNCTVFDKNGNAIRHPTADQRTAYAERQYQAAIDQAGKFYTQEKTGKMLWWGHADTSNMFCTLRCAAKMGVASVKAGYRMQKCGG